MESRWLRAFVEAQRDLPQGERSGDQADPANSSANPFAQRAPRLLFPVWELQLAANHTTRIFDSKSKGSNFLCVPMHKMPRQIAESDPPTRHA
jgi:hypothetical protein